MDLSPALTAFPSHKNSSGKRPYRAPLLVKYGQVRQLTQSGSDDKLENGAQCSNDAPHRSCATVSDRRAKENVVRIGEHPLGFALYLFDYKAQYAAQFGQARQFGVMADEIEPILPQAVQVHSCGFKAVNYEMLGIRRFKAEARPSA